MPSFWDNLYECSIPGGSWSLDFEERFWDETIFNLNFESEIQTTWQYFPNKCKLLFKTWHWYRFYQKSICNKFFPFLFYIPSLDGNRICKTIKTKNELAANLSVRFHFLLQPAHSNMCIPTTDLSKSDQTEYFSATKFYILDIFSKRKRHPRI